jgi:glycosyltransferase involved in cell wall biosynthesis
MKIGVNLIQYIDVQGIEVFAYNLLAELIRQNQDDEFVFFTNQESFKIFDLSSDKIKFVVKKFHKLSRLSLIFYQQFFLLKELRKNRIDLLFCPSVAAPIFYRKKIVTIHDCAAQRFPEESNWFSRLYLNLIFRSVRNRSLGVVTVSQFSKTEIERFLKIPNEHIRIISEGAPVLPVVSDSDILTTFEKFNIGDRPFFFYISNLRPRKNIANLLSAWKIFSEHYPEYILVIAGKKYNYRSDDPNINFLGPISDIEKVSLYKKTVALVFPSLYEGFGLPILEAQRLGVPVLSSNTSSLPEVAGASALFFNPHNPNSIADAMKKIIDSPAERRESIKKAYTNLDNFSWEKSARELLEFIKSFKDNL